MIRDDIFVKGANCETLEAFASRICSDYGLQSPEIRFSDSVAGGKYARIRVLGTILTFFETDDPRFLDFDYCIALSAHSKMNGLPDVDFGGLADRMCWAFALDGLQVVRTPAAGKIGGTIYRYSVDDNNRVSIASQS